MTGDQHGLAGGRAPRRRCGSPSIRARDGRPARPGDAPAQGGMRPPSAGRLSSPSMGSTTMPSTRRSCPQTRSTNAASWMPSTQIRPPSRSWRADPPTAREPGRRSPCRAPARSRGRTRVAGAPSTRKAPGANGKTRRRPCGPPGSPRSTCRRPPRRRSRRAGPRPRCRWWRGFRLGCARHAWGRRGRHGGKERTRNGRPGGGRARGVLARHATLRGPGGWAGELVRACRSAPDITGTSALVGAVRSNCAQPPHRSERDVR